MTHAVVRDTNTKYSCTIVQLYKMGDVTGRALYPLQTRSSLPRCVPRNCASPHLYRLYVCMVSTDGGCRAMQGRLDPGWTLEPSTRLSRLACHPILVGGYALPAPHRYI